MSDILARATLLCLRAGATVRFTHPDSYLVLGPGHVYQLVVDTPAELLRLAEALWLLHVQGRTGIVASQARARTKASGGDGPWQFTQQELEAYSLMRHPIADVDD